MLMVGFQGTEAPDSLLALLDEPLVTAVIWFARNVESVEQVARVNERLSAHRPDVLIALDQEGGPVRRLKEGVTPVPAMGEVADEAEARRWGEVLGRELAALGFHMNLAPVLDVDSNPANPIIGERSFGSDPEHVARLGIALHEGLVSQGVASCGKHFPGHGDTDLDSHLDLPLVTNDLERLRTLELVPFERAIAAGIPAIMSAHIVLPALDPDRPATLSPAAIDGLLRGELGFDGAVLSDDLEMKAVADGWSIEELTRSAVGAGVDQLLICHDLDKQRRALETLTELDTGPSMSRLRALAARFSAAAP